MKHLILILSVFQFGSLYANSLLLRSAGNGYAYLEAGSNNTEGKAIWVIKG